MCGFYSADCGLVFTAKSKFEDTSAQQTVLFDATTRVPLGELAAGTKCETVRVHVHGNRLSVLAQTQCSKASVTPEHAAADVSLNRDVLVNEVLQLFFRGHSMYAEGCQCAPRVCKARVQHLGVHKCLRSDQCVLGHQSFFTSSELAAELGGSSLHAECEGRSVCQALLDSGDFAFDGTHWTTRRVVCCQDSLVWYLLVNPLGVDADDWFIQYPHLARDIKALQAVRAVYVLENASGARRLFVNSLAFEGVDRLDKYRVC